ncbi:MULTISPECIES: tautomerase family protein [Campylobacter]|jgi:4-oxalocrotonate tautomerase family enzyme|uniref:Tautomerase n=1 Tax=Campylobacter curvus (strain 525.92) TaxID=360105 RepID=A7GWE1_CAMC5|nr:MULTISPECIES: 4-oxalocrotonate tautomerase family protein [Campylobacter]EAU01152.1 4-oxalocrotonate tautomerase family enzyme [Campylobacter curvus 525.92]EJP76038.1 4-oxalocrotonate tautomerase family enzyme [Campylobacter sp. FOBRC14]MBN7288716.1 4-oxalocrotonate tautomerase family protein [Campylobacter curvus]MDU6827984.1 4-oxalocrotonate tautomerase family protein [Campylobacter sp.]
MPFINVKMAGPEPSKEQKAKLVEEMTEVMVRVLGKQKERVMIFVETYEPDSIGLGGKTIEQIKKESK